MVNPNKKNQDGTNVDQVVQIRYKDEYSGTEVSRQLHLPGEIPEEEEEEDPQELLQQAFRSDLNVPPTVFDYVQDAVVWTCTSAFISRCAYLAIAYIPAVSGKLLIPILFIGGFAILVILYLVLIAGEQVGSTLYAYRLCLIATGILFAIL
ncbi:MULTISPECIES: hypothetical protein [Floridanema]|uniref:Uncharacterized protein n=2 Tax=Floridanema TaxID=3396149 RepID=A0ABV4YHU9_9CYAN